MKSEKSFGNGKIYEIVNYFSDYIYIGSTCSPLSKRLYGHKTDCLTVEKRNMRTAGC